MANDTWATILAAARIKARDTSTTNPGVSDAQYLVLFNRRYRAYYAKFEPRVVLHSSTTSGLTLPLLGGTCLTTPVNYARILAVFKEAAAGDTDMGVQMKIYRDLPGKSALDQLLDLRNSELGANSSEPNHVVLVRAQTTTAGSQGKWRAFFAPFADNTYYFSCIAELEATDLTTGTDAPDVTPNGSAFLTALTAYDAACLLNRPQDFKANLMEEAGAYADVAKFLGAEMSAPLQRQPEARRG